MVVFDATTLLYLLDPEAKAPTDPKTGEPVSRVKDRITFLVSDLEKRKEKIVVPTPALSELLVRAGEAGPGYLDILSRQAAFKIVDFDQRAAVEVAAATREALAAGDKRAGSESAWAKVKFDRQIIAIARVEGASAIFRFRRKTLSNPFRSIRLRTSPDRKSSGSRLNAVLRSLRRDTREPASRAGRTFGPCQGRKANTGVIAFLC